MGLASARTSEGNSAAPAAAIASIARRLVLVIIPFWVLGS
jgi:hypothetical protein